jgi:hypothetical protein
MASRGSDQPIRILRVGGNVAVVILEALFRGIHLNVGSNGNLYML